MVLVELDRQRLEAEAEVNYFLKKTWGIETFESLAPAAIIQHEAEAEAKARVYPLVLSRTSKQLEIRTFPKLFPDSSDRFKYRLATELSESVLWQAGVPGESTPGIVFAGLRGGKFLMGVRKNLYPEGYSFDGKKWRKYARYLREGGFDWYRPHRPNLELLVNPEAQKVSRLVGNAVIPQCKVHYFGKLLEKKSGAGEDVWIAGFGGLGRFNAADFLRKSVNSETLLPGNPKPKGTSPN